MTAKRRWEIGAAAALIATLLGGASFWGQYEAQQRARESAFAGAMSRNEGDDVRRLFREGASVRVKDDYGRTVLVWGSVFGDRGLVGEALFRGADVNAKAREDMTALMWAASCGHVEIVRTLLAAGADVNAQDSRGRTALSWAADGLRAPGRARKQACLDLIRQAGGTR